MATKPLSKPRRASDTSKEDLHVRISERPNAPETSPGEGGRYVYGIVETKEHLNFGKIGIGGGGGAGLRGHFSGKPGAGGQTAGGAFHPPPANTPDPQQPVHTVTKKVTTH